MAANTGVSVVSAAIRGTRTMLRDDRWWIRRGTVRITFGASLQPVADACDNCRATIFHDDADYRAYLERLERYRHRDGVTLHA